RAGPGGPSTSAPGAAAAPGKIWISHLLWIGRDPSNRRHRRSGRVQGDAGAARPAARASADMAANTAVDAADAARAAMDTARASALAADGAAKLMREISGVSSAAVSELDVCEQVFAELAQDGPAAARPATKTPTRRVGQTPRRLIGVALMVLPAAHRSRYREEWLGLLTELPTRRARARQVHSLLAGTPRQSWTLRRPLTCRRRA
ncbi:hypothetical protein ABZ914_08475, partial [Spirillospora sp. NPDC046719]